MRRVLTLAVGTGAAQLVNVFTAPLLTRLYSPAVIGIFGTYVGLVAMFTIFATWRYEQGIVVSRSPSERNGLFYLTVVSSCLLVLIAPLLAYLASYFVPESSSLYLVLANWNMLLGVGLALAGIVTSLRFLALKFGAFKILSGNEVLQTSSVASVQIGGGLVAPNSVGVLIVGMVVGTAVPLVRMAWFSHKLQWLDLRRYPPTWQRIVTAARRNHEYPKYMTWTSFCNSAVPQVPILVLGFFFAPAALGQFYLSTRIIRLPFALLANSMSQAYFKESSEQPRAELRANYIRRVKYMVTVGIVPFGALLLLAPWAFSLVFGPEWREAGEFTRIAVPGIFLQFIFTPFGPLFVVLKEQRIYLVWAIFRLSAVTAGVAIGALMGGVRTAVLGYSLALAVSFLLQNWLLLRLMRQKSEPKPHV